MSLTCQSQKPATSSLVAAKGPVDDGAAVAVEGDALAFARRRPA
jgi:hypothetical protein